MKCRVCGEEFYRAEGLEFCECPKCKAMYMKRFRKWILVGCCLTTYFENWQKAKELEQ